jgi:hypothetical protein
MENISKSKLLSAKLLPSICLAIVTGFTTVGAPEGTPVNEMKNPRFVQDEFAIGFWVDPPADQITDARYKEIAEANFTLVIGNFGPKNDSDIAKQLALCERYGMKAIVIGNMKDPSKLPDSPACWGYHIVDEPAATLIPEVKKCVDVIRKERPGKLAYFNLFPDSVPLSAYGTPTYDDYIGRFAKETGCDVLCMDHYPSMTPTADTRDGYCANLAVMRKHALANEIPFWNFFNIMPFGIHYDPTESHVRWQIYSSLAYGAKGILYFCYWTPVSPEFPKGGAIITVEGLRTRHYDQAKRINACIKNLGPTLMKLTSLKVIRVSPRPSDDPVKLLEGTPIRNITRGGDYLIGVFKHADGRRAVLINNYDHNYTVWPTVEFDVADGKVVEVDQFDGQEKPVRDDSPIMPGLQLGLDSGEGRLFLLPPR